MVTETLTLRTPPDFSFRHTIYSHGWCALPPFSVNRNEMTLNRLLQLEDGSLVLCTLAGRRSAISVRLESTSPLDASQRRDVKNQLRSCLRLDEDFAEFHREARRHPSFRWVPRSGAGRLLRAPTVFEDVVKLICTTNCSWALTETMVANLTSKLGRRFRDGLSSFPTPEALAGVPETFLRKNIRAGYRSPYLLELAERVAGGKLDIESWRRSARSTEELFKEARSVKGMGEYAAGNLLKLLGRYDYLGLDTWVRGQYFRIHSRGRRVKDRTIERRYERFGRWRGLFFWLEMTKHWFDRNPPF